jgi:hypothetical protein
VGTDAGAARFDGNSFRIFSTPDGLTDNTVFDLSEDHRGRVWLRTMSGKIFYYWNDSIYALPCNSILEASSRHSLHNSIHIDKGDTLWVATPLKPNIIKIAPPYTPEKITVIDSCYCGLYVYSTPDNGYVFNNSGCCKTGNYPRNITFRSRSGSSSIEHPDVKQQVKWASPFDTYLRLHNGDNLYTYGSCLIRSDNEKIKMKAEQDNRVITVYEDDENNIWVGLFKGGVNFYAGGDLSKEPVVYLPGMSITGITRDKEKSYWFSTLTEGIVSIPSQAFISYSLPKVKTIAPVNGVLWLGTSDGTVAKLITHPVIGNIEIFPSLELTYINTIIGQNDGSIMVSGKSFTEIRNGKTVGLRHYNITALTPCRDGGAWGGNYLELLKIENMQHKVILPLMFRVDALFEDEQGVLWVGGPNGLSYVSGKKLIAMDTVHTVFRNRIIDIKQYGNGLVMGTRGGGVIIYTKDTVMNITHREGLSSDVCRSVHTDHNGNIWVGTNNGISRIRPGKNYAFEITNINAEQGLLSNDVSQVSGDDKYIYIASSKGVTIFDPAMYRPNTTPPPVYILSVVVNGKQRVFPPGTSLNYEENYITFSFTGLTFKNPGKVRYKYILEGADKDWSITSARQAPYTTLPPGDYTFKVIAINEDGYESSAPASISFTISTPLWKTWWFMAIAALLTIGVIVLVFYMRYRRLKAREEEKAILNRKMGSLELKAVRAQMNPHFIFNSLNSIQRFVIDNDAYQAQKYLARFARLIRNVLDSSGEELLPLHKELQTLQLYIELESLRFRDKFTYTIQVNENIDTDSVFIPSMFIQPYIENAIWHGLMHKEGGCHLQVTFAEENGVLICTVEDNGVGRHWSAEQKKLSGSTHKSAGMKLNSERIETFRKLNKASISVHITDLTGMDQQPAGTRVEIRFPVSYLSKAYKE